MQTARPYQREAVNSVFAEWAKENVRKTLGVAPTGAGKTNIACDVIRGVLPKRTILLAHRIELVQQAVNRLAAFGIEADVEQGFRTASDSLFGKKPVVVATPQTLFASQDKRLKQFNPDDFGCLIIDECFPAGTPVDGKPIESFLYGDTVSTHKGTGKVTHVFRRSTNTICKITLATGKILVCTPNHPVWTPDGFRAAATLTSSDMVLSIIGNEPLRHLREGCQEETMRSKGVPVGIIEAHNRQFLQETRRRDHSISENQRYAQTRSASVGISETASNGMEAIASERQWSSANNPPASIGCRLGVADGIGYSNRTRSGRFGLSNVLQGGHWKSGIKNRRGSGRAFASGYLSKTSGPQEGRFFALERVERVEIFKQGSGNEFERLCPGGVVFNLEVSNGNTYFANGVLVHNCHHYVADAFMRPLTHFLQNPNLKVLGLTATADRADGEALSQIMDSVAFNIEICTLIDDGWLVPIEQQMVKIQGLDFSRCRVTAGDLNGRDLEEVMREEKNMIGVADASLKTIGDKRAIVFCVSVKQAERLAEIFNRYRANSADFICAGTPDRSREEKLAAFGSGKTQIMVNVGVLTEGYDNPAIEVVVMARPTKSRSLYAQMIGRGMRALTGVLHDGLADNEARKLAIAQSSKPKLIVLDFAGNSGRHKLITTADILGGKISEEAREKAIAKIKESGKAVNITEAMLEEEARIQREIEEAKKKAAAQRANLTADALFKVTYVDPFDAIHRNAEKWRSYKQNHPLTVKQRQKIIQFGGNPDEMTTEQGVKFLNAKFGMSDGQRRVLLRAGYKPSEIEGIRKWDASKLIETVAKNNWRRPKPEAVST